MQTIELWGQTFDPTKIESVSLAGDGGERLYVRAEVVVSGHVVSCAPSDYWDDTRHLPVLEAFKASWRQAATSTPMYVVPVADTRRNFEGMLLHTRRVVCAALQSADGDILVGIRHYSLDMHEQIAKRGDGEKFKHLSGNSQGFVDQWGNFLTRHEAYCIAMYQQQLLAADARPVMVGTLYSENLY